MTSAPAGPARSGRPARERGRLPPQAPAVGPLRRFIGPLHFTGVLWYRLHLFAARVLPEPAKRLLFGVFVGLFFVSLPGVRRALGRNAELVLGGQGWFGRQRLAWRTLSEYSWCLTERYERFLPGVRFEVRFENQACWERVSEKGSFILVTAHIGSWEAASELPTTGAGRRLVLVREAELDPRSQRFVAELVSTRSEGRYRTLFASDDPTLGLELLDALRAGEVVALQGDRPRAGGQVFASQILGVRFPLPIGPAALARSARVPMLPVFVVREGRRRYRVRFSDPIEVVASRDRGADLATAIRRLAVEIEQAIRSTPHQWFCFAEVGREHEPRTRS